MEEEEGYDYEEEQNRCGPHATYRKYNVLSKAIENLTVKQKREIFKLMRTGSDVTMHDFLPRYGFTVGEFSIFHVLTEKDRRGGESVR